MVSIIIPVYNAERFLSRCVDSVLAQTQTDIQLILVDDGSVDKSGRICDTYAEKDGRVQVIHQKNAGVSAARNAGLDAAKGEYICFVDADDTLEPNMLAYTTTAAFTNGADLVLFDPFVHEQGSNTVSVDSMFFFEKSIGVKKDDITPECLRFMAGTVWRVLYKRELLEKNELRFDTSLPLSEDRMFNIMAMGCCEKLYYLREPLYHYWINSNSAVRKYRENMLQIVLNTHRSLSRVVERYWGAEYLQIYEKVNLVDGALLCVYNAFAIENTRTLRQKYQEVKRVVNEPAIRQAYSKLNQRTLRQQLVWRRCSALLCVVGWLWNRKNKKQVKDSVMIFEEERL
jgi:glycosyltransferase involved in cell wall biosynthesis